MCCLSSVRSWPWRGLPVKAYFRLKHVCVKCHPSPLSEDRLSPWLCDGDKRTAKLPKSQDIVFLRTARRGNHFQLRSLLFTPWCKDACNGRGKPWRWAVRNSILSFPSQYLLEHPILGCWCSFYLSTYHFLLLSFLLLLAVCLRSSFIHIWKYGCSRSFLGQYNIYFNLHVSHCFS